jgi:hydroxymethylpyrimidine/phosphomethylpyrimidine kinase
LSTVLIIAGTDSSGGAGLTRDVATLAHFGVEALCAVTAVTAQSDRELTALEIVGPPLLRAQLAAAFATQAIGAVKIGMLARRTTVEAVADGLAQHAGVPVVLDPVLVSSSGAELLDAEGRAALLRLLVPHCALLTPNIPEAAALLGAPAAASEAEQTAQARVLCERGAAAVLLKGGHAAGTLATDVLVTRAGTVRSFSAPRRPGGARGTGCALAAGIAAGLASGLALPAACERAKHYLTQRLPHG